MAQDDKNPDAIVPGPLIVLFDGTCGLCDSMVNFILKRDTTHRFRFAAQQSQAGRDLLAAHQLDPQNLQTVVLIEGDRAYTKSTAVLRIAMELPEPWPLLAASVFVPQHLRDQGYDFIARHRHRWFKPKACPVPAADQREWFLA